MKVALVHDYLNEFGGAERVLEALCEIWPKAPIFTAFYKKGSSAHKRFKGKKIITSWVQNVPFFASGLYSPLRFLAPFIWGSFSAKGGSSSGRDFSKFDVVISSSNWYVTKGFQKGYKGGKRAEGARGFVEICYCHTPPRYLYGYTTANSQKHPLVKVYAAIVNHFMRVYDFEAAQKVDWFIANSREVQSRIRKFYRRDSAVIYPPVDIEKFARGPVTGFLSASALSNQKTNRNQKKSVELRAVGNPSTSATPRESDYFLTVSRLVGAKNVDVAVEVCSNLNLPLKVVGTGREEARLKSVAGETVEFLGEVGDDRLIVLYQNCRAVIFAASQEDFGIVPVEAMAAGKPVIALAEGGVKETVIDGKTGLLVSDLAPGAFAIAINRFMDMEKEGKWDSKLIRRHAQKFSKERFKREIKKFVEGKVK